MSKMKECLKGPAFVGSLIFRVRIKLVGINSFIPQFPTPNPSGQGDKEIGRQTQKRLKIKSRLKTQVT